MKPFVPSAQFDQAQGGPHESAGAAPVPEGWVDLGMFVCGRCGLVYGDNVRTIHRRHEADLAAKAKTGPLQLALLELNRVPRGGMRYAELREPVLIGFPEAT